MLGGALAGDGHVEEHALVVVDTPLDLPGVHHDGGQPGDEADGLLQQVLQAQVLGVLVVAVHGQHATGQLVHDVGAGGLHDHVLGKAVGQGAVAVQDLAELLQFRRGGQGAEEQQPDDPFEHKAVLLIGLLRQLLHVDAPVDELAGDGHHRAVLGLVVAHNVADVGEPRQHAGAVGVAQTPLDAQPLAGLGVDVVIFQILSA